MHWIFIPILFVSIVSEARIAPCEATCQSKVFGEIRKLYDPFFQSTGRNFVIETDKENQAITATANTDGSTYKLILYMGLLQSPRLREDILRIISCHEMGHILGGAPRRYPLMDMTEGLAPDGLTYISSEGQADYYATLSCFRRLVQEQDHSLYLKGRSSPRVEALCADAHGANTEAARICLRSAFAALDFLNLVKDFDISLEKPDLTITESLMREIYPPRQCRLDTMVAGALCKTVGNLELDLKDASKNTCIHDEAKRPPCWYK